MFLNSSLRVYENNLLYQSQFDMYYEGKASCCYPYQNVGQIRNHRLDLTETHAINIHVLMKC